MSRIVTIALTTSIGVFLFVFFTNDAFFDWAFARHQNTLSWAARPLLLLPYGYFAFRRSLNGVLATVLAILTSMFWFPEPNSVDPQVTEFLALERERLEAGFDAGNLVAIPAVLFFLIGLAAAFWRRSLIWAAMVALSGAVAKVVWSLVVAPGSGGAIIPFAVGGALALCIGLWIVSRRRGRSEAI